MNRCRSCAGIEVLAHRYVDDQHRQMLTFEVAADIGQQSIPALFVGEGCRWRCGTQPGAQQMPKLTCQYEAEMARHRRWPPALQCTLKFLPGQQVTIFFREERP